MDPADLELLERHAPIVRFNEGEYFLPASVESFVERSELWERTGPSERRLVAPAGTLDLDGLVAVSRGSDARRYLRLVSEPLSNADLVAWRLDRDRPRFRSHSRLGHVGVLGRFIDVAGRISLLLRGRVPTGAQSAAALLDRERPDHGDHPYYGRVLHSAGYVVLQYWYFYYFNDWRSRAHGVNDHEGDWEQVTIMLAPGPGDEPPTPAWVAYSAHDEVGADLRRRWDDPDLTVVDGHPVVFAGLGSHAGAYLPGEYLIHVRDSRFASVVQGVRRIATAALLWSRRSKEDGVGIPYVEYQRGDGVGIGHGQDRPWRPVLIDDDTPWVRRFSGLWGDDTDDPFGGERGPAGPRYNRDGSVRQSWSDPIGWTALDAVVPHEGERQDLITARVEELDDELERLQADRRRRREKLRAAVIGGASDTAPAERDLTRLAAQLTARRDERQRLLEMRDAPPPSPSPHAHLRHRQEPLPDDSRGRQWLLNIWSRISTPLILLILAVLIWPTPGIDLVVAPIALLVILVLEAAAQKRLGALLLSLIVLAAVIAVLVAVWTGLIYSWRMILAGLLVAAGLLLLVLNIREVRRT
ncbi:hypothetical protein [Cellulomonas bogoriensis]|uniref:Uncharacterized protein n=1 Tax=Cellulomonas bogoriensis 69B4 = DSM 16987 TaxID=1386082 RepID=A0A0A0C4D1_9CELL|nr:hypothetical protein [Cellulomonas bogoriensis]KGM14214.1 hypothetical protein N869_01350 [Cellulomonas bogoriensis 69B4 = DSM 16987]